MKIQFKIQGEPCGKGRPRFTKDRQPYTPKKTVDYEELIQLEYMAQVKHSFFEKNKVLKLTVLAYYGIPKGTRKWQIPYMLNGTIRPLKKPDFDNIGKIVADALNGLAYHDDAQIADGSIKKFYSKTPHVDVIIEEIDNSFSTKATKKDLKHL